MTVLNTDGSAVPAAPIPPPPPTGLTAKGASVPKTPTKGTAADSNLLLADIRNGVTLRPTKTADKSTPAFIKKSNGVNVAVTPPAQSNENGHDVDSIGDMKNALQEELRNTLKRKVKTQDVERGVSTKQEEIEKAIEINRTEVQLKVNNTLVQKAAPQATPLLQSAPAKPERAFMNGNSPAKAKTIETVTSPNRPKVDVQTVSKQFSVNTKPPLQTAVEFPKKSALKVDVTNSNRMLNGTLQKVVPHKELKIDVNTARNDSLKSAILSPEVKSGVASIRPSQIKTLTQHGNHVSHTDILQDSKPIDKSPISLVESPRPMYTPSPTPSTSSSSPTSSRPSSPRTPTRTTILDTKVSNTIRGPIGTSKYDSNTLPRKLFISHPKASFTLKRNKSINGNNTDNVSKNTETKPVFRILTNLEQAEQKQAEKPETNTAATIQPIKKEPPKADHPGAEPVLNSYVSFAKELSNAPNNHPDNVTKKITVGVTKEDLFFDKTNLRDIKFDIVENGQLRVVNK